MDLYRIIRELVDERNRLTRIIGSLEEAPQSSGASRGRKPMDAQAREKALRHTKPHRTKRRGVEKAEANHP